jgi:hypothetical protein
LDAPAAARRCGSSRRSKIQTPPGVFFGFVVFASAFLIFRVQPMVGKRILR